jgi:hypothetical protein
MLVTDRLAYSKFAWSMKRIRSSTVLSFTPLFSNAMTSSTKSMVSLAPNIFTVISYRVSVVANTPDEMAERSFSRASEKD